MPREPFVSLACHRSSAHSFGLARSVSIGWVSSSVRDKKSCSLNHSHRSARLAPSQLIRAESSVTNGLMAKESAPNTHRTTPPWNVKLRTGKMGLIDEKINPTRKSESEPAAKGGGQKFSHTWLFHLLGGGGGSPPYQPHSRLEMVQPRWREERIVNYFIISTPVALLKIYFQRRARVTPGVGEEKTVTYRSSLKVGFDFALPSILAEIQNCVGKWLTAAVTQVGNMKPRFRYPTREKWKV